MHNDHEEMHLNEYLRDWSESTRKFSQVLNAAQENLKISRQALIIRCLPLLFTPLGVSL
jgi:hypothetical protein